MKRAECLAAVYDLLADCAVVTIMGAVASELYSLGHRPNHLYLQHAMGTASSVGLGIALTQPRRRVVVLDGDGSLLMNLGTLTTLARYPGRVYSRFELISHVQGYDYEGYERTIDAHVKNLRRKIEPDPKNPRYVETVFGTGYRLRKA